MRIVAEILPARQEQEVKLGERATGSDLLRALRLAPDAHILVRGDAPIAIDERLVDGDHIRVLAVVSGGSVEGPGRTWTSSRRARSRLRKRRSVAFNASKELRRKSMAQRPRSSHTGRCCPW